MKKISVILLLFLGFFSNSIANVIVSGGEYVTLSNLQGIDKVYVFKNLDNIEFTYTSVETKNFVWKKFTTSLSSAIEVQSETDNQTSFLNIEDNTGYALEIDGNLFF